MHQAKIAAFLNQKGGVGKTTSVVNIGAGLSILGKKVLILDLDPQGHLTTFLGIDPEDVDVTIDDVLRGNADISGTLMEQKLGARLTVDGQDSGLTMSVIPSTVDLGGVESALALKPNREFLLRDALGEIRDQFDYILIDCAPSLGLLATNALVAARKVYIPVQTEYLAFESLENLFKKIEAVMGRENTNLEVGGLIATRFDGRRVINRSVVDDLRERFGVMLLRTVIRENIALAESPKDGKDIFTYRPRSTGAEDYLNLCLEILGQATTADAPFTVERKGTITPLPVARIAS